MNARDGAGVASPGGSPSSGLAGSPFCSRSAASRRRNSGNR